MVYKEHDFWMNGGFDAVEVKGTEWAGLAKAVVRAFSDRLNIQPQGKEILSGANSVAIGGHNPGHAGFRVDSGNESLMHLGDILHAKKL